MLSIEKKVKTALNIKPNQLDEELKDQKEPLLLKGLINDWPIVQEAKKSDAEAANYLLKFYQNIPLLVFLANKEIQGRFFYNENLSGFNFVRSNTTLDQVLTQLNSRQFSESGAAMYIGSTPVDKCLPGFRKQNDLSFSDNNPLASIWIGNKTRIAAHYDLPDNIACVAAGKRRFTLFPPEQLENLYIGPIDFNPAGQAISMVDFHQPDFDKFPKFKKALESAQTIELQAGDALFIPSMWWHHVEALTDFNVLINYWWSQTPHYMGSPMDALYHAILCIRDLPADKRKIWQNVFNHYIFDEPQNLEHMPESVLGVLSKHDEQSARKLRALISNYLRR